jgi:hypothetical protein
MALSKKYPMEELLVNSYFAVLKCFSTGIILGVAMLHLLPDSIEVLSTQTSFPCTYSSNMLIVFTIIYTVGIALATLGMLLTLGIDQAALHAMTKIDEDDKNRCVEPMVPYCRQNSLGRGVTSYQVPGVDLDGPVIEGHEHEHHHAHDSDAEVKAVKVVPSIDEVEMGDYHRSHGSVAAPQHHHHDGSDNNSKADFGHSHRHLHIPHDCDELGTNNNHNFSGLLHNLICFY